MDGTTSTPTEELIGMLEGLGSFLEKLPNVAAKLGVLALSIGAIAWASLWLGAVPANFLDGMARELTTTILIVGAGLSAGGAFLNLPDVYRRLMERRTAKLERETIDAQIIGNVSFLTRKQQVLLLWLLKRPEPRLPRLDGDDLERLSDLGILHTEVFMPNGFPRRSIAFAVAPAIWREREQISEALELQVMDLFVGRVPSGDTLEKAVRDILKANNPSVRL